MVKFLKLMLIHLPRTLLMAKGGRFTMHRRELRATMLEEETHSALPPLPKTWPSRYRLLAIMLIATVLAAEGLPLLTGQGFPLHISCGYSVIIDMFLSSAMFGAFLIYWWFFPRNKREAAIIISLGLIIDLCLYGQRRVNPFVNNPWIYFGFGIGLCAALAMLLRWWRTPEQRLPYGELITISLTLPIWEICSKPLNLWAQSYGTLTPQPQVYDQILYSLDFLLGFQPSFLLARIGDCTTVTRLFLVGIYAWLALWLVLAKTASYVQEKRCPVHAFTLFCLIGTLGSLLYYLVPAVGISELCGQAFPFGSLPIPQDPLKIIEAPLSMPRNCMPSLHLSWILAAFWVVEDLNPQWRRWGLFLVITTLLATINVGHHYLIDLATAVPFTLSLYALTAKLNAHTQKLKIWATVWGGLGILLTMLSIRLVPELLLKAGCLTWLGLALIVGVSLYLRRQLAQAYAQSLTKLSSEAGHPEESLTLKPSEAESETPH